MSIHANTPDHADTPHAYGQGEFMPINAAHVDTDEYECYLNAVVSSPPLEEVS